MPLHADAFSDCGTTEGVYEQLTGAQQRCPADETVVPLEDTVRSKLGYVRGRG